MTKSSADIEKEVEASRHQLDRNVEALKEKMTPGQLLDEAMHTMGGAGQQIASKFLEQAKQNPMPLAVMGLGIAWLMASNKSSGEPSGASTSSFQAGDGLAGAAQGMRDKAHGMADKAAGGLSSARDSLSDTAASAQDAAGELRDKALQAARSTQDGLTRAFQNEPLLLGALGLAVGLAVGAALPPTEAEDRLMGSARDRMVDKGKDLAQTGMEQAASAASSAYEGAKSEIQSGGDGQVADKLAAAVKTGVERAQEQIKPH